MINNFPEFGQLEISDQPEILELTHGFLHYSDFSFSNLWSWDIALSKRGYAKLNGNLIIKMFDYQTNQSFYTICGSHLTDQTVEALRALAAKDSGSRFLKLLPEAFAQKLTLPWAAIEEDRDNFDYIYSVEDLKYFAGGNFKQKRNEVNALIKTHPEIELRELDISNLAVKKELNCLFHLWTKNKHSREDVCESNEHTAFENLLMLTDTLNFLLIGLYLQDTMIAFMISELRSAEYAVGHFSKTDSSIKGANAFLLQSLAKTLSQQGVKYFNYEQDLGLKNLRDAKLRFRPEFFLKKYTLNLK